MVYTDILHVTSSFGNQGKLLNMRREQKKKYGKTLSHTSFYCGYDHFNLPADISHNKYICATITSKKLCVKLQHRTSNNLIYR